jgi:hypothetical protein
VHVRKVMDCEGSASVGGAAARATVARADLGLNSQMKRKSMHTGGRLGGTYGDQTPYGRYWGLYGPGSTDRGRRPHATVAWAGDARPRGTATRYLSVGEEARLIQGSQR